MLCKNVQIEVLRRVKRVELARLEKEFRQLVETDTSIPFSLECHFKDQHFFCYFMLFELRTIWFFRNLTKTIQILMSSFKTNSFEIYLCYGTRPHLLALTTTRLALTTSSLCLPKLKILVRISSQSSTKNVSTVNLQLNLKSILRLINH